jgi:hypothetical protein
MRFHRHGRACPGHPRLSPPLLDKDVDARDKRGHDAVAVAAFEDKVLL